MSSASPSRLPRLQFSLRGLLLFMLLVGVGIAVYRWPWEVERVSPEDGTRTKTRYRRRWDGTPVKHGLEVTGEWKRDGWEHWYDEGDMRVERLWGKGKVNSEAHYRGGKRHGRYWDSFGNGESETHGEYRHGQKHGEWKFVTANLVVREQWHDDQPDGRTTWETKAGRLLQSAEYERGRLTKWNDLPIAEALEQWLSTHVPDDAMRQALLTRVPHSAEMRIDFLLYGDVSFSLQTEPQDRQEVVVHFERVFSDDELDWRGRVWGEALLAHSLAHWQTFAFRYNMLNIVPIDAESLAWQDRTGVRLVRFEADSEQQRFWLQRAAADPFETEYPAARFQKMFEASGKDPITIDTSALKDPERPFLSGGSYVGHRVYRTRRDLFGQHLNREGCYVDQVGNTLIIKRHADD